MILDLTELTRDQAAQKKRLWFTVKGEYNQILDALLLANAENLTALASLTLTRNLYMSWLFNQMLDLSLVAELAPSANLQQIVARHPAQKQVIEGYLAQGPFKHVVVTVWPGYRPAKVFKMFWQSLVHMILQWFVVRLLPRPAAPLPGQRVVLLDMFLVPQMLQRDRLADRYYHHFCGYLRPDQETKVWMLPSFAYFSLRDYRRLAQLLWRQRRHFRLVQQGQQEALSEVPLLFKESLLSPWDVVSSLWQLRHQHREFQFAAALRWRGFDLVPLVRTELAETRFNFSCSSGMAMYRFTARLAKARIPVARIVDWFENQPLDKLLNLGATRFLPATDVVAHQGFATQRQVDFFLNPSRQEVACHVCPATIYVMGPSHEAATKEGNPDLKVMVGPAFRFSQIGHTRLAPTPSKTILVSMPYTEHHIAMIAAAIREVRQQAPQVRFVIKPHPLVQDFALATARELGLPADTRPYYEALDDCCGVLFAGSSSTLTEAVVLQRPAIVWEPFDEVVEISEEFAGSVMVVATPAELLQAVQDILTGNRTFRFPQVASFFHPVDVASVNRFIYAPPHLAAKVPQPAAIATEGI